MRKYSKCVLIAYVVVLCCLFVNTFPHGEEHLDLNFFIVPHFAYVDHNFGGLALLYFVKKDHVFDDYNL